MIDKLAWVHIQDGRLLAVRSRGQDAFFLPGGKREAGETDQQALVREVREELNVHMRPDTLRLLRVFEAPAHGKPAGVVVRMTCFTGAHDGEFRPDAEIEELAWLSHADQRRVSLATQIVMDWLRRNRLM